MTRQQATAELRTLRAPAHPDELPDDYMPRRVTPGARWVIPTAPEAPDTPTPPPGKPHDS
ncbi:hypothetical protein [Streptomyces platensis]|nr:hypothetical protein [Streptomyces platensis]WUB77776.1 hypothetical protein OG424_00320 [Streptomyces platensis]